MLHAYVLVQGADQEDFARWRKLSASVGVGWIATVTGRHDAIIGVHAPSLQDLERIVMKSIRGGSPSTQTVIQMSNWTRNVPLPIPPMPPPPPPSTGREMSTTVGAVTALVSIKAAPGKLVGLKKALTKLEGHSGSVIVSGEIDILAVFAAPSIKSLYGTLGRLLKTAGAVSTETAFVTQVHAPGSPAPKPPRTTKAGAKAKPAARKPAARARNTRARAT
jgi:hypothetical protein